MESMNESNVLLLESTNESNAAKIDNWERHQKADQYILMNNGSKEFFT